MRNLCRAKHFIKTETEDTVSRTSDKVDSLATTLSRSSSVSSMGSVVELPLKTEYQVQPYVLVQREAPALPFQGVVVEQ